MQYSSDQSKRLNLSTNQNAAFLDQSKRLNIRPIIMQHFSTNQNVKIYRPIRMQHLSTNQPSKIQRETSNHNAAFFDRIYISNLRRAVLYTSLYVLQEQYSPPLCILHRKTYYISGPSTSLGVPPREAFGCNST